MIGVGHVWIGFDGIFCQLIFSDLIWPTPSFSFLSIYQKINVLNLVFGNIIWPPPSFFYHCFVYFLKQMFSAFPYFLSFLSVFIGLMFSDIIWPPPFFIILYPIITRSKFPDIFWPFPYFLISFFYRVSQKNFKIEFLRFANYPPSSCQRSRWWRSRRSPSWCSQSFQHQTRQW